jgi:dihydropteroate synthase
MQGEAVYSDVVGEVRSFLVAAAERGRAAGVGEIWIDPGIGFAKTLSHNVLLLASIRSLADTGWPVLVGTSRKSFIGRLLADSDGGPAAESPVPPVPLDDRLEGSIATAVWAIANGAAMVRVHDVRATVQAVKVVAA